jgi:hypothetical protein
LLWQCFVIDFEQSQPTVGDVLSFIETIAHLYGPDKEIAAGDKGKVSLGRGLECTADDGGIVAAGDRRHDIQLMVGVIEELNGDSRRGSSSSILQDLKEREVERDLSIVEHPRPLRRRRLIGNGRSQDCLPQTLWYRALISPCDLAEDTA